MYAVINRLCDRFNRGSPIILQTPNHRSFGDGAEEILYGLLRAKRENKKVLFLYPRPLLFGRLGLRVPANREQFSLLSQYSISNRNLVGLLGGCLLSGYLLVLRVVNTIRVSRRLRHVLRLVGLPLTTSQDYDAGYIVPTIGRTTLWVPDGIDHFSQHQVDAQRWVDQYHEYSPPRMREGRRRHTERLRVQMGVPLSAWFVCLHVKDYGERVGRNSSLENYIDAIKAITDAGGWVVRLGDSSMRQLPPMERVIDYGFTRFKSEVMDIYLISQCEFLFGHNSGPSEVAALFGKPLVLVNKPDWLISSPLRKGDLSIFKHVFSRSRGRFLSVKELLEEPFPFEDPSVFTDEYVVTENTSEEILEVIEEFLTKAQPFEYSDLQETFNECRGREVRRLLEQGGPCWREVPSKGRVVEQYRIASRGDAAGGTLGQRYLEKNWLVDGLEESSTLTRS